MRSESIELDKLWSGDEAAKYLGVPRMTLYQWRHRKRVAVVELPGRAVLFYRDEIRRLRREIRKAARAKAKQLVALKQADAKQSTKVPSAPRSEKK